LIYTLTYIHTYNTHSHELENAHIYTVRSSSFLNIKMMDGFEQKDCGAGKLMAEMPAQESKMIDGEPHILTVYDLTDERQFQLDAYSLATSETIKQNYAYNEFDAIFRFHAELMNPNKKVQRWHWIFDRLTYQSDGGDGRKLSIHFEPTEESQVPYLVNMKMPIGRMDYGERQRLREDMDRLDLRRQEKIAIRKEASLQRFIKKVLEAKKLMELKLQMRQDQIEKEREERVQRKLETLRQVAEEKLEAKLKHEERLARIHKNELARVERGLAATRALLEKQAKEKEEKIDVKEAAHQALIERREAEQKEADAWERKLETLNDKRFEKAEEREKRVKDKTMLIIMANMKKDKEHERWLQAQSEKRKTICLENWVQRGELFKTVKARQKEIEAGKWILDASEQEEVEEQVLEKAPKIEIKVAKGKEPKKKPKKKAKAGKADGKKAAKAEAKKDAKKEEKKEELGMEEESEKEEKEELKEAEKLKVGEEGSKPGSKQGSKPESKQGSKAGDLVEEEKEIPKEGEKKEEGEGEAADTAKVDIEGEKENEIPKEGEEIPQEGGDVVKEEEATGEEAQGERPASGQEAAEGEVKEKAKEVIMENAHSEQRSGAIVTPSKTPDAVAEDEIPEARKSHRRLSVKSLKNKELMDLVEENMRSFLELQEHREELEDNRDALYEQKRKARDRKEVIKSTNLKNEEMRKRIAEKEKSRARKLRNAEIQESEHVRTQSMAEGRRRLNILRERNIKERANKRLDEVREEEGSPIRKKKK